MITESTRNLSALRTIAETLNQSLDLQSALHTSLEIITDLLNLKSGWVFLFRERDDIYELAASCGMPPALKSDQPCWKGLCQCNVMGREGLLKKACNMLRCSRIDAAQGDRGNLHFHASVPLETPRAHIGLLNIASETGDVFPDDDLDLLMAVGNQMAIAIERAQLFDHIRSRRLREHQSFLEISNIILNGGSFQKVLDEIARLAKVIFTARSCLLAVDECSFDGPYKAACTTYAGSSALEPKDISAFLASPANQALRSCQDAQPRLVTPTSKGFIVRALNEDAETRCMGAANACLHFQKLPGLTDAPFYAVPVRSLSKGMSMGMLYVAQSGVEAPSEDAHLLSLLANQAALAVEQSRTQAIKMSQQTMEHELEMARKIQEGFLPDTLPKMPGFEMATRYEAAHQVSGDFYDFFLLPDNKLGLVVADVAGKGMGAALVMSLCRTLLRAMVDESSSPLEAVLKTNRVLVRDNRSDKFVSLFYGVLDMTSSCISYVRAGHNPPFHFSGSRKVLEPLGGTGLVLGVLNDPPMSQEQRCLEQGDVIVFYTDGITEAMTENHREFGEERLRNLVAANCEKPVEIIATLVCDAVRSFRGSTLPSDDYTLIVLKKTAL